MRHFARRVLWLLCATSLLIAPAAFAQCGAHLLAALDENNPTHPWQTFDVSVWTNDPHCPASGTIEVFSTDPGVAFDYNVESFFDVFTEVHTFKPRIEIMAPPMMPFQIRASVTFDDPVYPPLDYVENVMFNPGTGRLEIVHLMPCTGSVPGIMEPEFSYCFTVCHAVYTIPLYVPGDAGEPIISVVPGCDLPCLDPTCTPGGPDSYRYDVYEFGGQWYLEFEYSDPSIEPVCYCVTYQGNLPYTGETHVLGGWENMRQTWDVSVWTNNLPVSGTIEVFSYPSGAQFEGGGGGGSRIQSFFDIFLEPFTFEPPVGPGSFTVGQQFQLIGCIHYGVPGPLYPPQWVVEDVVVTPTGGLELVNPGCPGPVVVPSLITPGIPECMIVCHDVYHIPLDYAGVVPPEVIVHSGCGLTTPCMDPIPCTPGALTDFRYDVYRVGGTWLLEFEYSNANIQPVCYCVEAAAAPTTDPEGFVLGAIAPDGVHMNVSVWGDRPDTPLNGQISLRSEPPGALIDFPAESFFDVFLEPFTWKTPVRPGIFAPGEVFQIVAEVDFFGPGSDPFDGIICSENVIVTPGNTLELWDPVVPCTGDHVPASMAPGQAECFHVCHKIYETILYYGPGGGMPVIMVTPGCRGTPFDECVPDTCRPGGPDDYVYTVYHNGVDWVLRFEYSNPYIEPVCYCVAYVGNVPWDCETKELAALDESYQTFDVSLCTFSAGGYDCPASGNITISSYPAGALIGPYMGGFVGIGADWYTIEVPVGPGTFMPGETFQLIAYVDYTDPAYPDRWLTEEVIVDGAGTFLLINDVGGECANGGGENVPGWMSPGDAYCFRVCHRIYHIGIDAYDPAIRPVVRATPGCYGEPIDRCWLEPCTPGGPFDYRWDLWWTGSNWELEFEYSNENIEPVCYCVSIDPLPCNPVTDLVIWYSPPPMAEIYLYWWAPQSGLYKIYSTTDPNNNGIPDMTWDLEGTLWGSTGPASWVRPFDPSDWYRNYVVICDCTPPEKK